MSDEERAFNSYVYKHQKEIFAVEFPHKNLKEHLQIPSEGTLKDIVLHFKKISAVIMKYGFEWDIHIYKDDKKIVVVEKKSQPKYIDDFDLLCKGKEKYIN